MSRARSVANRGWQATRRNILLNGNFAIAQRGAGPFAGPSYGFDRWFCGSSNTSISRRALSGEIPDSLWALVMTGTNATGAQLTQRVEAVNILPCVGKKATLSFKFRNVSGTLPLRLLTRVPTVQDNWTASDVIEDVVIPYADGTDWQQFSVTVDVPATALRGFGITLYREGTGSTTSEFAQVQLEEGEEATAFEHIGIDDDVYRCQRYYEAGVGRMSLFKGDVTTGNIYYAETGYLQSKRTVAALTFSAYSINGFPTASPTIERTSNDGFFCQMTANISGIGQFMHLWTASAEL